MDDQKTYYCDEFCEYSRYCHKWPVKVDQNYHPSGRCGEYLLLEKLAWDAQCDRMTEDIYDGDYTDDDEE